MNAYIILIGSEAKWGSVEPEMLGPFADHDAAQAWIDDGKPEHLRHPLAGGRVSLQNWYEGQAGAHGGYPAIHIISDTTCTSPDQWLDERREMGLDDDDDEALVDLPA